MALTPVNPAGTLTWPSTFLPQATTLPSLLRATEWKPPAAMAVTPDNAAAGTLACPWLLFPQALTLPLLLSATVWFPPAAMALTPVNPVGMVV